MPAAIDMKPGLERTKVYALALLIAALALLGLSTAGLDGRLLSLGGASRPPQADRGAAVDRFGLLFAAEPIARLVQGEQRRDVFHTTYFNQPAPPPAEPPKPKTRTVALTYLGLLSGSDGAASGFLRMDQAVLRLAAGSPVIHDWAVAALDGSHLVITNATQTNRLAFREPAQLTVPLP